MHELFRIGVTAAAALASYVLVLVIPCNVLLPEGTPFFVPMLIAGACAFYVARFAWERSARASSGLSTAVGLGAAITGATGFCGGFFGPMIFAPGANQGPMLGIFITGPLGVLLGAVGGGVWWYVRGRRSPVAG